MERYLLCIDAGGTFIKAAIIDTTGKQIAVEKQYNQVIIPAENCREYNLTQLWEICCSCMRRVIEKSGIKPQQIACIGISGQGKGLYPVGKDGQPLRNAITSTDRRAAYYRAKWEADGVSDVLYNRTGQRAGTGHPVTILAWLKNNEPESYSRLGWVFSMKDYLNFRLTGRPTAGKGTQSGSCMVDLITQEYAPELLDICGIPEMTGCLPEMIWDTELCGTVTDEAAVQCGCLSGTPVGGGMFDVAASGIAMGVIDEAMFYVITGTCAENCYISSRPVFTTHKAMNSIYSFPGTYLIEESCSASSGILEWVIDILYKPGNAQEREQLYSQINKHVDSVAPSASKLIFLPYLQGWSDCPKAMGAWLGLRPEHTRAHLLRAVYEGITFMHRIQFERLMEERELPSEILMAGGATNSEVWVQMFADVYHIPMRVVKNEEMGTKGAAIVSAVAVGIYPDITAAVEAMTSKGELVQPNETFGRVYEKKFKRFKQIIYATNKIWNAFDTNNIKEGFL